MSQPFVHVIGADPAVCQALIDEMAPRALDLTFAIEDLKTFVPGTEPRAFVYIVGWRPFAVCRAPSEVDRAHYVLQAPSDSQQPSQWARIYASAVLASCRRQLDGL